jgi:ribosomal protein L11 methyltransferase
MSTPFWQLTVPVTAPISEGLTNLVWELGALGVVEDEVLRAFFPPDVAPRALRARVRRYLDGLRALGYAVGDVLPTVLPVVEEAWAEAWKAHFRPIEVGRRLLVAPPWDTPATPRLTLVIEPGRAFGTGHHGSTSGCLVLLERLCEATPAARAGQDRPAPPPGQPRPRSPRGRRCVLASRPGPGTGSRAQESDTRWVPRGPHPAPIARALDLGTGSGILAIAAARLGVPEVLAVDTDPDAIVAAIANAARNGVPDRVRCAVADAARLAAGGFPLVLANLLAAAHLAHGARYRRLLCPGGTLILGGILEHEAGGVAGALTATGLVPHDQETVDGWASLALRRL